MRTHNERSSMTRPGIQVQMMRVHNYILALLLATASVSRAHADRLKIAFMGDFVSGIAVPLGDSNYKKFTDPSFKVGVRAGAIFYVHPRFGIAPEAELDWIPINTNDNTYQNNQIDAQFNRVRFMLGGRFIVPFGIGSFYARIGFGVDYITGSTAPTFNIPLVGRLTTSFSSTAFGFEPGLGVQFNVVPHLVIGGAMGFPIASHNFGNTGPLVTSFTAVDVDFLATIGLRI
jgi:opacity protein-like surface antigen